MSIHNSIEKQNKKRYLLNKKFVGKKIRFWGFGSLPSTLYQGIAHLSFQNSKSQQQGQRTPVGNQRGERRHAPSLRSAASGDYFFCRHQRGAHRSIGICWVGLLDGNAGTSCHGSERSRDVGGCSLASLCAFRAMKKKKLGLRLPACLPSFFTRRTWSI